MFILKKILNSSNAVPECIRVKIASEQNIAKGMLLAETDGGKVKNFLAGDKVAYVSCEDVKMGEKEDILCYAVTPDMIFSAVANEDLRSVAPGSTTALTCCDAGYLCFVTSDPTRDDVTIISNSGAKQFGDRLLIKLNNIK